MPGARRWHSVEWCFGVLVRHHLTAEPLHKSAMKRLSIALSPSRYVALKAAAVQRGKTMGQLIDESLDFYGIKSRDDALDLVRRARASSQLDDQQAMTTALDAVAQMRDARHRS